MIGGCVADILSHVGASSCLEDTWQLMLLEFTLVCIKGLSVSRDQATGATGHLISSLDKTESKPKPKHSPAAPPSPRSPDLELRASWYQCVSAYLHGDRLLPMLLSDTALIRPSQILY